MGYVLSRILPWLVVAVVAGFFLGRFYWWCRLWLAERGPDDRTDRRTRSEMAEQLARMRELEQANADLADYLRDQESLRPRVKELESSNRELLEELASTDGLREQMANLENTNFELTRNNTELGRRVAKIARSSDAHALRHQLEQFQLTIAELTAELVELQTANQSLTMELAAVDRSPSHSTAVSEAQLHMEIDAQKPAPDDPVSPPADPATATKVLGHKLRINDLQMIEGIGPKIAELCKAAGIETWQQLAKADTTFLQLVLDEAGARFRMHDPSSWPRQALLLAEGNWEEFTRLKQALQDARRK